LRDALPYSRQQIDDDDVAAVVEVLRSDWLTTGPRVEEFERAFAAATGARHAVAVANGTAALHTAYAAAGLGPGDEVIVPAMTFAATANAAVFVGARPVFADVDADALLLDPESVAARLGPRTRAIVAVDYAGQPCRYDALEELARRHGATLLADACHSLGASWRGRPTGTLAAATAFSFHPVKPITTAEGGMVTSDDEALAERTRRFRNHGIDSDLRQREAQGTWSYSMLELGYNYRLSDLHAALGISQLRKLPAWLDRRRRLAAGYDAMLAELPGLEPLGRLPGAEHAYHLYVVRLRTASPAEDRRRLFDGLRRQGIGVNVHYLPVHLHPYYRRTFGTGPGLCPRAETAYDAILSLPLFPAMADADVERVVSACRSVLPELAG
jgi:perosamine synthetase